MFFSDFRSGVFYSLRILAKLLDDRNCPIFNLGYSTYYDLDKLDSDNKYCNRFSIRDLIGVANEIYE